MSAMTADKSSLLHYRSSGRSSRVTVSTEHIDEAWDEFVAQTEGGHHVQTSLWARVKGLGGWTPIRIVMCARDEIVGGAQLLVRDYSVVGSIAYVPRGPLFARDDVAIVNDFLAALGRVVREQRIRYLVLQPALDWPIVNERLLASGYRRTEWNPFPASTLLIDLRQDLDTILSQMHKKKRYGIRRGQRDGVVVRQGDETDIETFYRLLQATADRRGFRPYSRGYFIHMWRVMRPAGHVRLFLASIDDVPISAHWVIPFGDTVVSKVGGWTGTHGHHKPNEVLEWEVIRWAKEAGYRSYDLGGIDIEAARLLRQGESLPPSLQQTPTSYKIGFGNDIQILPDAYEYFSPAALRWAYEHVRRRVGAADMGRVLLERWRGPS